MPKTSSKSPSFTFLASHTNDLTVKSFAKSYKTLYASAAAKKELLISTIPIRNDFQAPKNPIVLCHGLSGFDRLILMPSLYQLTKIISNIIQGQRSENFIDNDDEAKLKDKGLIEVEYWMGVKERLEQKGCTVLTASVPSFGSIEERATILNAFLERETAKLKETASKNEVYNNPNDNSKDSFERGERIKLNLIAHSMGGLDSRFLISKIPNRSYEILSLTTVSTPHHGSEMADYVVNLFEELKKATSLDTPPPVLPPCFYELTTKYMNYFNENVPNDPKVSYYSYGSFFQPKWHNAFYTSWKIIYNASDGEPNDGMVTVKSSIWGEYQGTLTNTDHLDLINWRNRIQHDIGKLFENTSDTLGEKVKPEIDILNLYLAIADILAKKGF